jgi:hypothetical protein
MPECFCEDGADEYAHQVIGTGRYEAAHGGLDWVISSCRECDGETLVPQGSIADSETDARWVCFFLRGRVVSYRPVGMRLLRRVRLGWGDDRLR